MYIVNYDIDDNKILTKDNDNVIKINDSRSRNNENEGGDNNDIDNDNNDDNNDTPCRGMTGVRGGDTGSLYAATATSGAAWSGPPSDTVPLHGLARPQHPLQPRRSSQGY